MREQLQRHRDLTLQLLWEEYRQKHPDGYSYSYFCERYERWRRKQDVVLRQEHRPGEKLFVDWAGATIPIHHAHGGITHAPLFVSALGVSSYTYAELTPNQQMEHWLKVQMHAFEFYGGCPQLLVPDNTKTGVIKACRYEPDLNPTYQEFATHYHVAVLPARPHKPRDGRWAQARVNIDYHVAFDGNWYSVPYTLTGELVDVRCDACNHPDFPSQRRSCVCRMGGGRSASKESVDILRS